MGFVFPGLQKEYQNPAIFRPWSDPLMTLFFAYPFVLGLSAAYLWSLLEGKMKGATPWERGFSFVKLYAVIATIPGMFASLTTFQVSFWMILSWTVTGLAQVYASGVVFAKMK